MYPSTRPQLVSEQQMFWSLSESSLMYLSRQYPLPPPSPTKWKYSSDFYPHSFIMPILVPHRIAVLPCKVMSGFFHSHHAFEIHPYCHTYHQLILFLFSTTEWDFAVWRVTICPLCCWWVCVISKFWLLWGKLTGTTFRVLLRTSAFNFLEGVANP